MSAALTFSWHPDATIISADACLSHPDHRAFSTDDITCPLDDQARAMAFFFYAFEQGRGDVAVSARDMSIFATANTPMLLCQTGGTTASPKRIRRSCASWMNSFAVNMRRFGGTGHRIATLGHLSHSLTLYAACEALVSGATYIAAQGCISQIKFINDHRSTVLYATPTQMRALALRARGQVLDGLQYILLGGGVLDQLTLDLVRKLCPNAQIRQFYGATETSFISITDDTSPLSSVGKPFEGVDVTLADVDPETGNGDIWVRSPYLADGYDDPNATGATWRDGWVCVGEQGSFDALGNLYIAGRKGRMFLVADKNVFPEDIETLILAHTNAQACAVLAQPEPLRGARAVVCVASDDAEVVQDVHLIIKNTLPPHLHAAQLRHFLIDDWPVLPSGKPDLRRLAQLIEAS